LHKRRKVSDENGRYDRKWNQGYKPTAMEHVHVDGWVQLCVGEWCGDKERTVFGSVVGIDGRRITIEIFAEDESSPVKFSPAKTGLEDGQIIEVDLEDICASEFSPVVMDFEAFLMGDEIETELIDQHKAEFDAFCPPEYREAMVPKPGVASREEWDAWMAVHYRFRHAFAEQLIRRGKAEDGDA